MAETSDNSSNEKRERERGFLAQLKEPKRLEFSEKMKADEKNMILGRQLWEKVLYELREEMRTFLEEKERRNNPNITDIQRDPGTHFHFMGLPRELRDMVYDFYFEDRELMPRSFSAPRPPPEPTRPYTENLQHSKEVFARIEEKIVKDGYRQGNISKAVLDAYDRYKTEHRRLRMPTTWFRLYRNHQCITSISANGMLYVSLPPLACVSRGILKEVWKRYLARHIHFRAEVRNFNFRPLFRLCRMLRLTCEHTLTVRDVCVVRRGISNFDSAYKYMDEAFKRHWFEGFPLWRLSPEPYWVVWLLEMPWLFLVSQAAALYRIDRSAWKDVTKPVLEEFEHVGRQGRSGKEKTQRKEKNCIQLAEDTLRMIRWILRHYQGPRSSPRVSWTCTCVRCNIAEKYRREVGRMLRERLGDSYADWEDLDRDASVPDEGVI